MTPRHLRASRVEGASEPVRVFELLVGVATEEHVRRERLSHYFSPDVAALIAQEGDRLAAGEVREVTVLFADLRGFTALTERLEGSAVVQFAGAGAATQGEAARLASRAPAWERRTVLR